jgi:DNA modification methylase
MSLKQTRYEIIGNATLYLADCFDLLPEMQKACNPFGALVTDPPYGIGDRMQGGTWGAAEKYADFRKWDKAPTQTEIGWLLSLAEQSVIWGGNYFAVPPSRCWLVWDKRNAVPTMADCELAWTNFDKPAKRFSWPVGIHSFGHPTEKPVALMDWCIAQTDPGTVIDPFMGTGTTGIACVNLNRKFLGVEVDAKYFDIACERISAAYAQGRLFA